jgi:hypothetical protein
VSAKRKRRVPVDKPKAKLPLVKRSWTTKRPFHPHREEVTTLITLKGSHNLLLFILTAHPASATSLPIQLSRSCQAETAPIVDFSRLPKQVHLDLAECWLGEQG